VSVAGAGLAPYVVGQDGGAAYAEVQRQPSDIFPEHKNRRSPAAAEPSRSVKLIRENALLGYPPTKPLV
jgi:hypothetical protein